MQKYSFEDIYYTLCGEVCEEYAVPGIENVYAEGAVCDVRYSEMSEAYERLRHRLGVIDEDEDVEIIINNLMDIQRILCERMYHYGRFLR
jgi:hypothetical protein